MVGRSGEKMIAKLKKENGYVTVVALIILVILTFIGISASRTSSTDILIARNQIPYKQGFYIAEGGQNKEATRIGRGDYPVAMPTVNSSDEISAGNSYDYEVKYKGRYPAPAGYSSLHFNRYDYEVITEGGDSKVKIKARYYSIGPKVDQD